MKIFYSLKKWALGWFDVWLTKVGEDNRKKDNNFCDYPGEDLQTKRSDLLGDEHGF